MRSFNCDTSIRVGPFQKFIGKVLDLGWGCFILGGGLVLGGRGYVYIYIYTYVYMSVSISMFAFISTSKSLSLSVSLPMSVYLNLFKFVFLFLSLYAYLFLGMYLSAMVVTPAGVANHAEAMSQHNPYIKTPQALSLHVLIESPSTLVLGDLRKSALEAYQVRSLQTSPHKAHEASDQAKGQSRGGAEGLGYLGDAAMRSLGAIWRSSLTASCSSMSRFYFL